MQLETYRHRPDGHDGICARCGAVLSPVHAVLHFGVEVLEAAPETRVRLLLAREAQIREAGALSIPVPRRGSEVVGELKELGVSSRLLVVPCRQLPPRSRSEGPVPPRDEWTFVDYLAALSRAVDRQITKALKPAPRRRDALRRRARKTRG
jgi:hypothetical protein